VEGVVVVGCAEDGRGCGFGWLFRSGEGYGVVWIGRSKYHGLGMGGDDRCRAHLMTVDVKNCG
jgi:hypothetical protein